MADLTVSGANGGMYPVNEGDDGTPVSDSTNIQKKPILKLERQPKITMYDHVERIDEKNDTVRRLFLAVKTVELSRKIIDKIDELSTDSLNELVKFGVVDTVHELKNQLSSVDTTSKNLPEQLNKIGVTLTLVKIVGELGEISKNNANLNNLLDDIKQTYDELNPNSK